MTPIQLLYRIKEIPGNIKYGIRNLICWLPVIWKDRWYDWDFLLRILEHKLRTTGELHMKRGQKFHKDRIGKEMLVCADLCKRIFEDDYREYEVSQHKERWGTSGCPVCGGFFCDCFPAKDGTYLVSLYENVKTEMDDKCAIAEIRMINDMQDKDMIADIDLLFDTMKAKLRQWWD